MKILFDQGVPLPLREYLVGHEINTAHEQGWSTHHNGDLLLAAEVGGYDAIITTDQNLRYQQNLAKRKLAILVLLTTSWPRIRITIERVQLEVSKLSTNDYVEIPFPRTLTKEH